MHLPSSFSIFLSFSIAIFAQNLQAQGLKDSNKIDDLGFELNEAQSLIYDRDQLQMLHSGDALHYSAVFYNENGTIESEDQALLKVIDENDAVRRTIDIDFLTGDNQLPFADFPGVRGNPLLMAVLTRDVLQMREATSGSDAYFRNRLRYAFAENPEVTQGDTDFNGSTYKTAEFSLMPYVNDKLIERFPLFENKSYTITVGDNIPGGIYSIDINNPSGERALYTLSEWSKKK